MSWLRPVRLPLRKRVLAFPINHFPRQPVTLARPTSQSISINIATAASAPHVSQNALPATVPATATPPADVNE